MLDFQQTPCQTHSWWQRLWRRLTPSYEMALERIVDVAPLQGKATQLFVSELGKVLQEFPQLRQAKVCNVRTSRDDWQLLLLVDFAPESRERRQLGLLHHRLQRLLAINLLCRQHCPATLLARIEQVAQPLPT